MDNNINVVLASSSPRRHELLKMLFSEFEVCPADINEENLPDIPVFEVAEFLAAEKAKAISCKNALVIACDTVVISEDKILGKPKSTEDAIAMLSQLSEKTHVVVTGVCLCYNDKSISFSEKTEVEFYNLSKKDILAYIATGEPFDKAGAYGIQGLGAFFVKGIKGDYYNVVGLPVARLRQEILKLIGIQF